MANRICEQCVHYDVCLLHEDNFIDDVVKNGFCGKFKNKADFVEVKGENALQILTDTYGEPYMVIAKGKHAKHLVKLMQKDEVNIATERRDT